MGLLDMLFGHKRNASVSPTEPVPRQTELLQSTESVPPGDAGEFVKAARAAWRSADFNRARLMYQKSAYAASIIQDTRLKEQVNTMIKAEQAKYVVNDPLFNSIVSAALSVIHSSPGIIQSKLYEHLPYEREQTQWALYYAEVLGRVRREKKGRSYVLSPGNACY